MALGAQKGTAPKLKKAEGGDKGSFLLPSVCNNSFLNSQVHGTINPITVSFILYWLSLRHIFLIR